jgi:hypothetical protein
MASKVAPEVRASAVGRVRAGEPAKKVAAEFGVTDDTLRNWRKTIDGDPRGVPPPAREGRETGEKRKSSGGRRPITEATAGMLIAGIFTLIAIVRGPEWVLTPLERDSLASPMADSMRTLPGPAADAINTWSAPATFFCAMATVIGHKFKLETERKAAKEKDARPPLRPVPNGAVPRPAPNGAATHHPAAPNAPAEPAPPTLAEAVAAAAAARGNLRDMPEEAEAMLS